MRAGLLLVGFYTLTLGLATVLFVGPLASLVVVLLSGKADEGTVRGIGFVCFLAWVPAAFLVRGLSRVKRITFEPPGGQLVRKQAPAFFDMLDELAREANTAPPSEVYMSPLPTLGVTEVGGRFGYGGKRVLILGLPILHVLRAQELRAALAHELGHYLGGDTKLCGVLSYCETSFRSVQESMRKKPGADPGHFTIHAAHEIADTIGDMVVGGYARFYLKTMRPPAQLQELAADALAVRLVGRAPMVRALETVSVFGPMYEAYLAADVVRVLAHGVVPEDLVDGFHQLRAHLHANGTEAKITEQVRTEKTDPWDNHPSLGDRVAAMNALDDGPTVEDERTALDLFVDRAALDKELVYGTSKLFLDPRRTDAPRPMPWAKIPSDVIAPEITRDAAEVATMLGPRYPHTRTLTDVFVAAVRETASHGVSGVVFHLVPNLRLVWITDQARRGNEVGARALARLLQGALVESGAEVHAPFMSTGFNIVWKGIKVNTVAIACEALSHPQGLDQLVAWANELEHAKRPEPDLAASA